MSDDNFIGVTQFITEKGFVSDWLRLTDRVRRKGKRVESLNGVWVGTFLTPEEWAKIEADFDKIEQEVRNGWPAYHRREDGSLPRIHPLVRKPEVVHDAIWYTATEHVWWEEPEDRPP